jgi:hypothetical protein
MTHCAAVITNTDPKDCSSTYTAGMSRMMGALNANRTFPSETVTHYATNEEHRAAAAALAASPYFADDCEEDDGTSEVKSITSRDSETIDTEETNYLLRRLFPNNGMLRHNPRPGLVSHRLVLLHLLWYTPRRLLGRRRRCQYCCELFIYCARLDQPLSRRWPCKPLH